MVDWISPISQSNVDHWEWTCHARLYWIGDHPMAMTTLLAMINHCWL
uniref:Uncharacterized protein n=1 Tax=Picea glauca TaxID=3330 RepID=A0A101LZN1_PICGL|nr:hypothetical protein ABT39_MTgene5282 [Picea glauca]QHR88857.1 hypothetical protein Q903MT_gene2876 [Picea sitchensis]